MIKSAAIKKDGIVYEGKRHNNILHDESRPKGFLKNGVQGFVTDTGEFVTRERAAKIAYNCGQIKEPKEMLFSEDIC